MEISVRYICTPAFVDSPLAASPIEGQDPAYGMYRQYAEDLVRNEMRMWARIVLPNTPATARLLHDVSVRWPVLPDDARRFAEQLLRQAQLDFMYKRPQIIDGDEFELVDKVEDVAK